MENKVLVQRLNEIYEAFSSVYIHLPLMGDYPKAINEMAEINSRMLYRLIAELELEIERERRVKHE